MDIIQECAKKFKSLVEKVTYTFHTSLNKKVSVFHVDFEIADFHHAIGLQYLKDIEIPNNTKKTISWVLNDKKPITDEYLDEENIVFIYSPKDSPYKNSIIPCDYIIKSHLEHRKQTVFIFLKHRSGKESPCKIISFGVKKSVEYGGIYQYVMLKDKTINGERINMYKHPRYTGEQIMAAEHSAKAAYIEELISK